MDSDTRSPDADPEMGLVNAISEVLRGDYRQSLTKYASLIWIVHHIVGCSVRKTSTVVARAVGEDAGNVQDHFFRVESGKFGIGLADVSVAFSELCATQSFFSWWRRALEDEIGAR